MDYYCKNGSIILRAEDFSLCQTLDCGQAFRWNMHDGEWTGFFLDKKLCITQNHDIITLENTDEHEFLDIWADYFDLNTDYGEIKRRLSQADPTLEKACAFAGGIRLLRQDFWETLVSFIISQNNNIPRIKGIISRLCEMFGGFPQPQTLAACDETSLAPLKSGFRAKYLLDSAEKVCTGAVERSSLLALDTEAAEKLLMTIKGVGPKVASCVALFGLSKTDAFPVDVWIGRVLEKFYPQGFPEELYDIRGIAQQYLFHYIRTAGAMK